MAKQWLEKTMTPHRGPEPPERTGWPGWPPPQSGLGAESPQGTQRGWLKGTVATVSVQTWAGPESEVQSHATYLSSGDQEGLQSLSFKVSSSSSIREERLHSL